MATCRNEQLNAVDAGTQQTYPRSCIICKFGPCQRDVIVPGAMSRYATAVAPAVPAVHDKYAVIHEDFIYHPATPGDERSRTNPGHGYPAEPSWNEPTTKLKTFEDKAGLLDWIAKNERIIIPKKFTAIKYQELKVSTRVEVDVA